MIRHSVEDRQSRIVWQTLNEVSKRKSTAKAKLKAASQKERIHLWKEHSKNLLGKSPKIMDEPITKIFDNQQYVKDGQFTQKELDVVQQKSKTGKLPVSIKYPQKYERQGNSTTYCSDTATAHITRKQQTHGQRVSSSLSPRKVTSELPRTTGV